MLCLPLLWGCRSTAWHRATADRQAGAQIERLGRDALGREQPYAFDSPADNLRRRLLIEQQLPTRRSPGLPAAETTGEPPVLSLVDALQIGAAHSREYQNRKEAIFRAGLDLDTESEAFRTSWSGILSGHYRADQSAEPSRRGVVASAEPVVSRTLAIGTEITTRLAFDLVRLLTLDRESAYGLLADASVTVPLLRGAGRRIVREPLTQAERQVVYTMYDFERYKRAFAVRTAAEYLGVLERYQQIQNAEDNFRRLALSTRRAEHMAEAGRLPATQVDQTRQDLLRARERLISARQDHTRQMDAFKLTLGLPVDARIRLDPDELDRRVALIAADAETVDDALPVWEEDPLWRGKPARDLIELALAHRLDLRRQEGRIEDARRAVEVARDGLRGVLKLEAGASYGERRDIGSADRGDARLRPGGGRYRALLQWEPPWRRFRERNRYRERLLDLERAERDYDEQEDTVKQQLRDQLRGLDQARESRRIQQRAVALAERRVESTELFLQAGRAQIRDVLEAQEALVSARNARLSASVRYLVTEWGLQRDMDVLTVMDDGRFEPYAFED